MGLSSKRSNKINKEMVIRGAVSRNNDFQRRDGIEGYNDNNKNLNVNNGDVDKNSNREYGVSGSLLLSMGVIKA